METNAAVSPVFNSLISLSYDDKFFSTAATGNGSVFVNGKFKMSAELAILADVILGYLY